MVIRVIPSIQNGSVQVVCFWCKSLLAPEIMTLAFPGSAPECPYCKSHRVFSVQCAWCGIFVKGPHTGHVPTKMIDSGEWVIDTTQADSHGICIPCKEDMMMKAAERRKQKVLSKLSV